MVLGNPLTVHIGPSERSLGSLFGIRSPSSSPSPSPPAAVAVAATKTARERTDERIVQLASESCLRCPVKAEHGMVEASKGRRTKLKLPSAGDVPGLLDPLDLTR